MTRMRAERLNQNSTVAVIKPKQTHYNEVELRGIAESGVNCLLVCQYEQYNSHTNGHVINC